RFPLAFNSALNLPASTELVFWEMHCTMNTRGKLTSLLFRMPVTLMDVKAPNSRNKVFRALPNLFDVPTLGSALPMDLDQWAAIFDPVTPPKQTVSQLAFFGPAAEYYNPTCDVELLHPAN